LQVVGDLGISAGDDFTISAWIKLDPGFLNFNAIVSNYHDNGLKALMFRVNSNWNGHINALDLAEGYSNNGVLSTGTWLHVVGVYTNSTRQVRFYVNGNDAGTGTTPYTIEDQTTKFAIGGDYLNVSPRYFKGTIDEVRFYKYALTATEVGNLYRNDDINDNTP
ncbi:MAG TPA: LamG domain-containing protein, partial [Spirochaetota bacterium]|nr:LamG domain-containing protein [Spirochaetota bacterium]